MTPTDHLLSIDLGSGATPAEGFIGIDLGCGTVDQPNPSADRQQWWAQRQAGDVVCLDLFRPDWCLPEDGVRDVWCSHFVEHIPAPHMRYDDRGRYVGMRYPWVQFFTQLWRVCCHNAKVTIVHPFLQSVRAFQDPTHCDFIPAQRWAYLDREWRQANGLDHDP